MFAARARNAANQQRLTELVERALAQDFEGHVLEGRTGELEPLTQVTNRLVDKYRKASKRRAREKDRLYTILMHMSNGALILSQMGRVRLINPAAAEILHITPDEATRKSFVQVVWDHRIAEVWQRCQASGAEETESIELGGDRFVRVTVTPFLGGDAAGYLVILQDLSIMRRLEKVRRDFISNVSHELRTPLASVAALVDTLRDGALDDPPAAQRFLDRMEVEVDKMAQMVAELLELSRVESGQLPLRLSPTTLQSIVNPAVERLATQAERAGLALAVELPAGLPNVVVDSERTQQVMINLIHNAIKFTPSGGVITVRAEREAERPGMLVVCVRDTGVGIPAANLPRIFERFYKMDRARSGSGTGLGLAIAKHTIQAHGGEIWVTSREGKGSSFYFTLPIEVRDGALATTAAESAAPTN
jgi:two-component system phosphate regulon sensor histidine kinase PhoR